MIHTVHCNTRYTAYSQATEALVMAGNKLTIARGQSFRHSASQTPNLTPTNNGEHKNPHHITMNSNCLGFASNTPTSY
jgi:hypothetical protein